MSVIKEENSKSNNCEPQHLAEVPTPAAAVSAETLDGVPGLSEATVEAFAPNPTEPPALSSAAPVAVPALSEANPTEPPTLPHTIPAAVPTLTESNPTEPSVLSPAVPTEVPALAEANPTEPSALLPDVPTAVPAQETALPHETVLPPIIREVVCNAPASRKMAAFVACLAPLCALATRVRLHYYYDSRPSALLLQVLIEGAQSSGKSFAADVENLIMQDTLKARDKQQRREEQAYREKKKRKRANDRLEEEPQTTVRVIPPTISKTVLTKRADLCERVLGDTMTFWMFAEELAQVTDAGKQGYSNLRTIMRTAYDLGSQFGIDYASDNSYSAIVDINICSMFCCTPAALDDYYDRKAIEGGNITRCIVCPLTDEIGADGVRFRPYGEAQRRRITRTLNRMMADTYAEDGSLQPEMELDMHWMDADVRRFIAEKGAEAAVSGSVAMDVFRKRASVSAFRVAALCYYLYSIEESGEEGGEGSSEGSTEGCEEDFSANPAHLSAPAETREHCRRIYRYMAEYILQGLLQRWGGRFETLNAQRAEKSVRAARPNIYDHCGDLFTRGQLALLAQEQKLTTPPSVFLSAWRRLGLIETVDKDTFRKLPRKNKI